MSVDDVIDDEDEDVIVQGTSLYQHLHELGYVDFESISVQKSVFEEKATNLSLTGFVQCAKNVFKKLFLLYSNIIQEDGVSRKQLKTILNAKVLLHDHASAVYNFFNKYKKTSWRVYAYRDLKSAIILQNDVFNMYKKGLKILRYGYKIKLRKGKCSQQFYNLTAERLRYLQPLLETIVKCLEHASSVYYRVSLMLIKLLPADIFHEDLLTKFESEWFETRGEIHYQKLKNLYHTYILVQSEMLYLLAIAYDTCTWRRTCNKVPEVKLAYIVNLLVRYLTVYKKKVSQVINDYYHCKMDPISFKYKRAVPSRLQHLYMHLCLACNKLQLAYEHISAILENIDQKCDEDETSLNRENTRQRMIEIVKGVEDAKGFIEFSNLYLVKLETNERTDNLPKIEMDALTSVRNLTAHIANNSEAEILDEVFEDYVKDEYLMPLIEEADDISFDNKKRDKWLIKNFLTELKDALVDKEKSMSERESRALERMSKNTTKAESDIPASSAIPPVRSRAIMSRSVVDQQVDFAKVTVDKMQPIRLYEQQPPISATELAEIKDKFDSASPDVYLPKIQLDRKLELILTNSFSKANEETFMGSGENSEDEMVEGK